jgi:hypothetical protein
MIDSGKTAFNEAASPGIVISKPVFMLGGRLLIRGRRLEPSQVFGPEVRHRLSAARATAALAVVRRIVLRPSLFGELTKLRARFHAYVGR